MRRRATWQNEGRPFTDLYNLAVDSFKLSRDFQVKDRYSIDVGQIRWRKSKCRKGQVLCHSTIFLPQVKF